MTPFRLGGRLLCANALQPTGLNLQSLVVAFTDKAKINAGSLGRLLLRGESLLPHHTELKCLKAMPRRAEQKKLKRTLLRELHAADFDNQTSEIAHQAISLDPVLSEHESDNSEGSVSEVLDPAVVLTAGFTQGTSPPTSPLSYSSVLSELPVSKGNNDHHGEDGCSTSHLHDTISNHSSEEFEDPSFGDSSDGYEYSDGSDSFSFDTKTNSDSIVVSEARSSSHKDNGDSIAKDLVKWSFDNNIKHKALDELLDILRKHGHSSLPKLSVTLLQTPHRPSSGVVSLGSGEYWYHGLLNCFKIHFQPSMSVNGEVVIDFFVDGISPYDKPSQSVHLWPIAGRIICEHLKTKPFVVALWCGQSHEPDDVDEFFNPFVNECLELMNGFELNGVQLKLRIRNAICDAPARSMSKKTNPHQSLVCCERCTIRCIRVQGIMSFLCVQCQLRTDESFSNKSDPEYHKGTSPLEKIMKMVSQFPLEPLHLVDLGVTKRLLMMLVKTKASRVYLKPSTVVKIGEMIALLPQFTPSEFGQWKPKSLKHYKSFKGKELKRFLKYDGLLTMWLIEQELADEFKGVFKCFLKFSLGIRILSDHDLCLPYVDDAKHLLNEFVKDSAKVFGQHFIAFNVHHVTHLADDCKLHGPLDNFDAYLYESYLGQFSKFLNAPGRPLPQIIARIVERENHDYTGTESPSTSNAELSVVNVGPTARLVGESYAKLKSGDYTINRVISQ